MLRFNRGFGDSVFNDMWRVQREVDSLYQRAIGHRSSVFPPINIYDGEDGYHIHAELPGIDPATLDITVSRNEVVVKGERVEEPQAEGQRYHRRERNRGSFSRAFALPDTLDAEKVTASYSDGVLEIIIPQLADSGPRKVAVQTH